MESPTAVGQAEYSRCGDKVQLYFRLHQGVVEHVTFTAKACGPAVAAASMASVLLKGRTIGGARCLGVFELNQALGDLPSSKRHAILLVLECLHEALGRHPNPKSKQ